jgi:hypothetical protein
VDLEHILADDRFITVGDLIERYLDLEHDVVAMTIGHESSFTSPRSTDELEMKLEQAVVILLGRHEQVIGSLVLDRLLMNDKGGWELHYGVVCRGGDTDRPVLLQP